MSKIADDFRNSIRLEIALSYRFPIPESFIGVLAFTGCFGVVIVLSSAIGLNINPTQNYNGTQVLESYSIIMTERSTLAVLTSLQNCITVLSLLLPIFFGIRFARSFEDGTLRTFLSYPISRTALFRAKIFVNVMLTTSVSLLTTTCTIMFLIPGGKNLLQILLVCYSFMITNILIVMSMIFLSVLLKNSGTTTVVGVLLWYVVPIITQLPDIPLVAISCLMPITGLMKLVQSEFDPQFLNDILIGTSGTLLLIIILIIVSHYLFSRAEV